MLFLQKTSRLVGGFEPFFRIDLILSVRVGKIVPRLRRSFVFPWDFWRRRNSPRRLRRRRRVERPKIKSAKVFDGLLVSDRAASWD